MTADRYDPFKDESLGKPRKRKPPVMIDWKTVARRLAEGESPGQVAAALGLKEDRIWDHLKRSLRFRFLLQQALERQRMLLDLRIAAGGRSVLIGRGLQAESMDGELLRCLLAEEAVAAASADLKPRIEELSATGARRPPNAVLLQRIATERRAMDAFVAETAALLAARGGGPEDVGQGDIGQGDASRETERTQTAPKEAETNANEPDRSETNANEAERTETKPPQRQAGPVQPAPRPPLPPRPPQRTPERTIVDLDSPDLARLKAEGQLPP